MTITTIHTPSTELPSLLQPAGEWETAFSYHPFDVELASASGVHLVDTKGRKYIDASGGPMSVNIGHGDPRIREAIEAQLRHYAFVHPTLANRARARLSQALVDIAQPTLNSAYLASGGSEAVETAIKIARQYHFATGNPGKYKVVSYYESYHGMTLATMALAGNAAYRTAYEPMLPSWPHVAQYSDARRPEGVSREDWGITCAQELERLIAYENPATISAFIATPHGSGPEYGLVPPRSYWAEIRRICDAYDVLLIADEVVTAFGRTGRWFAMEHFGVVPDLVTVAKGISSSTVPLAAVLVGDRVNEPFRNGTYFLHGFTNAGNALACAAGLAVIDIIRQDGLLDHVAKTSETLFAYREKLLELDCVADVRGWGLFMALELVESKTTREYYASDRNAERLLQAIGLRNGIVLYSTLYGPRRSATIRRGLPLMLAPPLSITEGQTREMMDRLLLSLQQWRDALG